MNVDKCPKCGYRHSAAECPALSQPHASEQGAAPEVWKLVPVEPTVEMKIAGDNAGFWCGDKYRAMLAAAPGSSQSQAAHMLEFVRNMREHIGAGALAENAQYERGIVGPYLDSIEDELISVIGGGA